MKIALVGDLHLGHSEDALVQGKAAMQKACQSAEVVIVAGDLFDSRVPKPETMKEALSLFSFCARKMNSSVKIFQTVDKREKEAELPPIVAIFGTHERRSEGMANPVEVLAASGAIAHVEKKRRLMLEKDGQRVCVQGIGGVPEEYAAKIIEEENFAPVEGAFNVFVFHQTLHEVIPQALDASIKIGDLPRGFDLYVDGHIHWGRELNEDGRRVVVTGSTVVTQMRKNETGPKGFYTFDSVSKKLEFLEIPARAFEFEELQFKDASLSEIESSLREKLEEIHAKHVGANPIVKVKLKGSLAKGLLKSNVDLSHVLDAFKDKMLLSVDKELDSQDLKEKVERLRKIRSEKKSVREMGMEILRLKLEKKLKGKEDELFDLLSEGKVEKAMEKI